MEAEKLSPEQIRNFNLIELRIINQRYVELLDELLHYNVPTNNRKLRSGLSAIYSMLDKESKKFDEIFNATPEGTTAFYEISKANAMSILSLNLIDKNLVTKCLLANETNPKALDGILTKILK